MTISLEQAIESARGYLPDGARLAGEVSVGSQHYFFAFGYPSKTVDESGNLVEDVLLVPGGPSCIVISRQGGEPRFADFGGSIPYDLCGREPTADELEIENATELEFPN